MINGYFTIRALVGCNPISTFTTWVSTFIASLGGSHSGGSGSWMIGRMAGVSSFFGYGREDTAKGRNPGNLGGLKTLGFLSLIAIPRLGQFFSDRRPCKGEIVFQKWERFHLVSYTWQWGQLEYRPHHTLLFGDVGWCDMILNCWIKQGGSMAGIYRACWWSMWVRVVLLSTAKLAIAVGSGEEVRWWRLKMHVMKMAGGVNEFYSWRDAKCSWRDSVFLVRSIGSQVYEFLGHEILIDWYICSSSGLLPASTLF